MSHKSPHNAEHDSSSRKYETTDVAFKPIILTGLGLLGIMVFGLLISWGVYTLWQQYTAAPGTHAETMTKPDAAKLPPLPNLQPDPHSVLLALRRAEDSVLTSYGWSRDSTFMRVPIDRGMELLVRKGLPYQAEGSEQ
jgi:hypothetical protein